jgi:serine/threonine protein phosphatase PrpC
VAVKASKFAVKDVVAEEDFQNYLANKDAGDHEKRKWLVNAMEQGLLKCDDRIRLSNQIDGEDCDESGCTANLNFVTDDYFVCANVGDTRAVLCRGGKAVAMSKDHKPTDPDETKRIEAAGARVTRKRVNAAIAVSRSLGDYFFKSNGWEEGEPEHPWLQPLICKPTVEIVDREPLVDEFLLCCCDGVWDVMTNEEGVEFVRERLRQGQTSLSLLAADMLNTCLGKGSKDNMTCVIVLLPAGSKLLPNQCCAIS